MEKTFRDDSRRQDLDWLRIILFLLLIFYHIGMFYVPWGWHVKSQYAPLHDLTWPMILMNPWRIPALFLISGIVLRFAFDKTLSEKYFLWARFKRLILPVLFGMLVICAPQAYFELLEDGADVGSIWSFYRGYLMPPWLSPGHWTTITPTYNHLWYVVYVLLLTLIIIPLCIFSKGKFQIVLSSCLDCLVKKPWLFLSIPVFVTILLMALFNQTLDAVQMVWGDWFRLSNSLWIMVFGFAIAKHKAAWEILWRFRWALFGAVLLVVLVHVWLRQQLLMGNQTYDIAYHINRGVFSWLAMYTIFGFGQSLPRGSDHICRYLSDAVFPYYVVHQTIIIVLGVYLTQANLGLGVEAILLILGTTIFTAGSYHYVIRHLGRFSLLFGGR